ncbi:hypothetical protein [Streptomyces sp. Z26]|uniref:hypothetical protein n=1 Tax=Streptomyces sp. Z26 TaxID=2500177 RepID=UPI000EF1314F|nr:hypothetical protein [Streptomyces sp. Z26]RLL68326.1 hypothetical protein D7M15_17450 [Streptomyces sp. Z26]
MSKRTPHRTSAQRTTAHRTTPHAALAAAAALGLAGSLLLGGVGRADEPQPGGTSPQDLARASAPQWNFPRANSNDPCWPEDPFDSEGRPKKGTLQNWPDSDGGCAPHGADFPTFFTAKRCDDAEIRASYTIYQASSGFKPSGHPHDFEHVDVVWKRDGDRWTRSDLLLSAHGKHRHASWDEAESWNGDRTSAGLGREYPRVFVGFGSHSMFNDQKAGLKDVLSAYTDLEYRQADYPVWSDEGGGLVEVVPDGDLYREFKENASAFGSANGNPAATADRMCEHS